MHEQHFRYCDFPYTNHPRETVNWYQAMAFCRWLSWRMDGGYDLKKIDEWKVRLPTKFEWEKAARSTDRRIYPYQGEYDPMKGNTYETGINQTSAVGIFPNGHAKCGAHRTTQCFWREEIGGPRGCDCPCRAGTLCRSKYRSGVCRVIEPVHDDYQWSVA